MKSQARGARDEVSYSRIHLLDFSIDESPTPLQWLC